MNFFKKLRQLAITDCNYSTRIVWVVFENFLGRIFQSSFLLLATFDFNASETYLFDMKREFSHLICKQFPRCSIDV